MSDFIEGRVENRDKPGKMPYFPASRGCVIKNTKVLIFNNFLIVSQILHLSYFLFGLYLKFSFYESMWYQSS